MLLLKRTILLGSLLMLLISGEIFASNMYESHEEAYSFSEAWEYLNDGNSYQPEDFFPVAWDIRQTHRVFRSYGTYYYNDPTRFDHVFESILDEAVSAGVNLAFIRNELSLENVEMFEYVADAVRERGIKILAGGLWTVTSPHTHNDNVLALIGDYLVDHPNSIIGGGGMDCPDSRWFEDPAAGYLTSTEHYANAFEDVGFGGIHLPFTSFLEKQDYCVNDTMYWSIGFDGAIYQFCKIMSLPTYDWYPCKTCISPERFSPSAAKWIAADIHPESETGNYYNAYTNRDELISMNDIAGKISLDIYEFQKIPGSYHMDLNQIHSLLVPKLDWSNFEVNTSGPLSSDCGDRSLNEHDLSGGLAFWEPNGSLSKVHILYHDGVEISCDALCEDILSPFETTNFVCIGQDDYLADNDPNNATGVLCQDDMRVLLCFDRQPSGTFFTIYRKAYDGEDDFVRIDTIELSFKPAGAVWGYFWEAEDDDTYYRSGFVLYDESGQYAVVHRNENNQFEEWTVTPGQELFGELGPGEKLIEVDVFRSTSCPFISPVRDYLVGSILDKNVIPYALTLVPRIEEDGSIFQFTNPPNSIAVTYPLISSDVSEIVIRPSGSGKCRLFISYDSNKLFRSAPFSDDLCGGELTSISDGEIYTWINSEGYTLRIRPTRRSYAYALTTESNEPYIFTAQQNPEGSQWMGLANLHTSIDVEQTWGVVEPSMDPGGRINCLMTTVQAFGRQHFNMSHYCPILDSLMYMAVSPVIHGARALLFYNLGSALESSPGVTYPGAIPPNNRLPWEMTGWGASIDPEYPELDMVSTVHAAVAILTGNIYNGQTYTEDFLSATVSDDWLAMPGFAGNGILDFSRDRTRNVAYLIDEYGQPVEDQYINFLALQNILTEEVYVMVVNDSEEEAPLYRISLPEYLNDFWDVECVYAEENWKAFYYPFKGNYADESTRSTLSRHSDGTDEKIRIKIVIEYLPPFTAALFHIVPEVDGERFQNLLSMSHSTLNLLNNASTSVNARVLVADGQDFLLTVYDLSGRAVSQESGTGETLFSFYASDYPAGTYFISLETGGEVINQKMLLLP